MNLDAHLSELRRKHESLAQKIEEEQRSPGSQDAEIARLKKEKLRIKDEIQRLASV